MKYAISLVLSVTILESKFEIKRNFEHPFCNYEADTLYYESGAIKSIRFIINDTGCLAKNRKKVSLVFSNESCWDCGKIIQKSTEMTKNGYSYSVIKERVDFMYSWWENRQPKSIYNLNEKNGKLWMSEENYDSSGKMLYNNRYYYVRDSVFDFEDSIFYTGWFKVN
jgi:hypothetical protein